MDKATEEAIDRLVADWPPFTEAALAVLLTPPQNE